MIGKTMGRSVNFIGAVTALLCSLNLAPTYAEDEKSKMSFELVNSALVDSHVLTCYQQLADQTQELASIVETSCSSNDPFEIEPVRNEFHEVMDAWMAAEHLNFGPIELFMRNHRVYFWPQARFKTANAIHELIATLDEMSQDSLDVSEMNVAVQGLLAVEYLLFSENEEKVQLEPDTVGCDLLTAVSDNLHNIAADTLDDWTGGEVDFANHLKQPQSEQGFFEDYRTVTRAFFRSLANELQLISDVKLKPVIGENMDSVRVHLAESALSRRSHRNVIQNLHALQSLYLGNDGPGLSALVLPADEKLDKLMRKAFRKTIANAESIDIPLEIAAANADYRPSVEKLLIQVQAIGQIVRNRVANALSFRVGFNSLDGD